MAGQGGGIGAVQHHAPPRGNHLPITRAQLFRQCGFHGAEGRLAAVTEDLVNRLTAPVLDDRVRIDERKTKPRRQKATHR